MGINKHVKPGNIKEQNNQKESSQTKGTEKNSQSFRSFRNNGLNSQSF
jgi:hypothetical protein